MQQLLDAKDDAKCKSFGAKPGTDTYVNCRLQLQQMKVQSLSNNQAAAQAAAQQDAQNRAAVIQKLMNWQAAQPIYQPPPVYQMPVPRQSTNCTSNRIGDYTYTNCN